MLISFHEEVRFGGGVPCGSVYGLPSQLFGRCWILIKFKGLQR